MKESEIRPKEIFEEYLRLAEIDLHTYFKNSVYTRIDCPACGGQGEFAFNKKGFSYELCPACRTLYVSPRPDKGSFDAYYKDSASTKYWATTFYKVTEAARREKIWTQKAMLIAQKAAMLLHSTIDCIIDIGGGYGVFAEEIKKLMDVDVIIIEPSMHLAKVCKEKGFTTLECVMEDLDNIKLPGKKRLFVSFELFEHLCQPMAFIRKLHVLMEKDDSLIFTTLNGMGADILAQWENSKAISPPHHLNFFNPRSISAFLKSHGFEPLDITTPGRLDVDIMSNSIELVKDRFWKEFVVYSSDTEKALMQKFLSENLLSSHMMVICKKQ